jgi:hypothetical protein
MLSPPTSALAVLPDVVLARREARPAVAVQPDPDLKITGLAHNSQVGPAA